MQNYILDGRILTPLSVNSELCTQQLQISSNFSNGVGSL